MCIRDRSFILKGLDLLIQLWISKWQAQLSSLRSVKSVGSDCAATHDISIVPDDLLIERLTTVDHVGIEPLDGPLQLLLECCLKG